MVLDLDEIIARTKGRAPPPISSSVGVPNTPKSPDDSLAKLYSPGYSAAADDVGQKDEAANTHLQSLPKRSNQRGGGTLASAQQISTKLLSSMGTDVDRVPDEVAQMSNELALNFIRQAKLVKSANVIAKSSKNRGVNGTKNVRLVSITEASATRKMSLDLSSIKEIAAVQAQDNDFNSSCPAVMSLEKSSKKKKKINSSNSKNLNMGDADDATDLDGSLNSSTLDSSVIDLNERMSRMGKTAKLYSSLGGDDEALEVDGDILSSDVKAKRMSTSSKGEMNLRSSWHSSGSGGSITEFETSSASIARREAEEVESAMDGGVTNKLAEPRLKRITKGVIAAQRSADYKDPDELGVDKELIPPDHIIELWIDVAEIVMRKDHGSVSFKEISNALESAKKYYTTSKEGRDFVDENLYTIADLILSVPANKFSSAPDKFGLSESSYAEKSIRFVLQLINEDLKTNAHKFTADCETLEALELILNPKQAYYESNYTVRVEKILVFQRIKGFHHLANVFNARSGTPSFPDLTLVHLSLEAAHEGLVYLQQQQDEESLVKFRKNATSMVAHVIKHLSSMDVEALSKIEVNKIYKILSDLNNLSQNLAVVNHAVMPKYTKFCQDIITKLLLAPNEHKVVGKNLLFILIQLIHGIRPLYSAFVVKRAGLAACDGIYTLSTSNQDGEGFVIPGMNARYERTVKITNQKFILFLDTNHDSQNLWRLSEKFGNGPMNVEYMHHYTSEFLSIGHTPPLSGWNASKDNNNPAPYLEPVKNMIPIRNEHKALKEDFAKWFLDWNIIKLVIGVDIKTDSSSVAKLTKAIDAFMDELSASDTIADLFFSILPSISSSSDESPTPQSAPAPSCDLVSSTAFEEAKQRLAFAENWHKSTSKMLVTVQKENDAALQMLQEARAYLSALEKKKRNNKLLDVSELSMNDSPGRNFAVPNGKPSRINSKSRRKNKAAKGLSASLTIADKIARSGSNTKSRDRSISTSRSERLKAAVLPSIRRSDDGSRSKYSRQYTR